MKIKILLFFFVILGAGLSEAENLSRPELSELVTSFFAVHEKQLIDFQAKGGYLPDTAQAYSLLNKLEAEDLAKEPSSVDDRLESLNYLKLQVINVGIICAPTAGLDAKELSAYRRRVLSVFIALENREAELLSDVKTPKKSP